MKKIAKITQKPTSSVSGPTGEKVISEYKADVLFDIDDRRVKFQDVLIMPGLKKNLLSVRRLTERSKRYIRYFQPKQSSSFQRKNRI